MAKVFFDTNILIYACSQQDLAKREVAEALLVKHGKQATGVISTQTLAEFFDVMVRKLGGSPLEVKRIAEKFLQFEVVEPKAEVVLEAMDLVALHSLSTWDALILSAALSAKCSTVYSEDMQHGFKLRGLAVTDPFAR